MRTPPLRSAAVWPVVLAWVFLRVPEVFGSWLPAQAQVDVLADLVVTGPSTFGGVELEANASLVSFGVGASLGYERRVSPEEGEFHGGDFGLAFQWRFLQLAGDVFHFLDPHLDLGFTLGGAEGERGALFRSTGWGGVGLDIGFAAEETHFAVTVRYRFTPLQAPWDMPWHSVLVGFGIRYAD